MLNNCRKYKIFFLFGRKRVVETGQNVKNLATKTQRHEEKSWANMILVPSRLLRSILRSGGTFRPDF